MNLKTPVITVAERVDSLKDLLLEMLKDANTIAVSLAASFEDAQLEPLTEPMQDLFSLLGVGLSDVLHLEDELKALQSGNA